MRGRLHEMRLSEPRGAVQEQRVVAPCRPVGDGETRRLRQPVVRADDETVEGVAFVQAGHGLLRRRRRLRVGRSNRRGHVCHRDLGSRTLARGGCRRNAKLDRAPHDPTGDILHELPVLVLQPLRVEPAGGREVEDAVRPGDRLGAGEPGQEGLFRKGGPGLSEDHVPEFGCAQFHTSPVGVKGSPSYRQRCPKSNP